MRRHASVRSASLSLVLLLLLASASRAEQTTPGILHEEISTTERTPQQIRLQPITGASSQPSDAQSSASEQDEHLIDQMDVYALSSHAHYLAQPRMVAPELVIEARQGRAHLPTPSEWSPIIARGSALSGVDPKLIEAVISVESSHVPTATSPKGAQGLMQLMPATQAYLGVTDPFDPQANVQAGSAYLREQLNTFGTVELALAAYNAGPGNVHRYGGIPPFAETRDFVRRVLALYRP